MLLGCWAPYFSLAIPAKKNVNCFFLPQKTVDKVQKGQPINFFFFFKKKKKRLQNYILEIFLMIMKMLSTGKFNLPTSYG